MDKLVIVKIGGNIIDDAGRLSAFLQQFAAIDSLKILVHGGGKLATELAAKMQVPQQMVDGRRITDAETLRLITMVYAGSINKNIVATLQSKNCNAIGFCGADGNAILSHKRTHATIDYGFVGDIDLVNASLFQSLLKQQLVPVIAPVTHDGKGQLLNTNADTMAQAIATAMSVFYAVDLVYSFEKAGVLLDVNDPSSVIRKMNSASYQELKNKGAIFAGMIPKLDNAFAALGNGVRNVIIGQAESIEDLIKGKKGTTISNA